jgi:hypothetical protein
MPKQRNTKFRILKINTKLNCASGESRARARCKLRLCIYSNRRNV